MSVRCGRCLGCQIDYSRDWAVRGSHEAAMNELNCAVTLTYSERNLPADGALDKEDLRLFFKNLRRNVGQFRYLACGEYGSAGPGHHPHYHVAVFGLDFDDKYFWTRTDAGSIQYRSPLLEAQWKLGNSTVGECNWQSIAYIARYITKKIRGDKKEDHYQGLPEEFITMSTGREFPGGLGAEWFKKHFTDVYPDDFVFIDGKKYPVPRYYDKIYESMYPDAMKEIKRKRQERAKQAVAAEENIRSGKLRPEDVREECLAARTSKLERNYEDRTSSF